MHCGTYAASGPPPGTACTPRAKSTQRRAAALRDAVHTQQLDGPICLRRVFAQRGAAGATIHIITGAHLARANPAGQTGTRRDAVVNLIRDAPPKHELESPRSLLGH